MSSLSTPLYAFDMASSMHERLSPKSAGLVVALLCLSGCADNKPPSSEQVPPPTQEETVPDPAEILVGDFVSLTQGDGTLVSGEVIARYDHQLWWHNAEDARTLAIFDHDKFAPYPMDESMHFVREADIAHWQTIPSRIPYDAWLREWGISLHRPPLDDLFFIYTGHESYHLEENGMGDFAWDIMRIGENDKLYENVGMQNEDYWIWGAPIKLPSTGFIVDRAEDNPDNLPGHTGEWSTNHACGTNNCVGVHLGGNFYLYLLHLQQDSIPDEVVTNIVAAEGTYVGNVGNSGITLAPHLHITMLWHDRKAGRSWSVPSEFLGVWLSSSGDQAKFFAHADPHTGDWVSPESF